MLHDLQKIQPPTPLVGRQGTTRNYKAAHVVNIIIIWHRTSQGTLLQKWDSFVSTPFHGNLDLLFLPKHQNGEYIPFRSVYRTSISIIWPEKLEMWDVFSNVWHNVMARKCLMTNAHCGKTLRNFLKLTIPKCSRLLCTTFKVFWMWFWLRFHSWNWRF